MAHITEHLFSPILLALVFFTLTLGDSRCSKKILGEKKFLMRTNLAQSAATSVRNAMLKPGAGSNPGEEGFESCCYPSLTLFAFTTSE